MLLNKLSMKTALIITTPLVVGQNVLSPPAQVPDDASAVVKPSFPSFGIQGSSFPAFTGDAKNVNVFSRNLIEGLQNRTGGPLVIRIGGTNTPVALTMTMYSDFAESNPNQAQDITPPQNGAGIGQRFVFGPSFFEGLQNWPNTKIIFDIPFAHKNRTNALFFAQNALKYIGASRLEALEIGNEPDFYVRQKARPDGWGPAAYVQEWNDWAYWLSQQLNLPGKSFQGLTLAAFHPPGVWSAKTVIDKGITSQGHIKSISLHHYQTTDIGNIQASLMSHNAMRTSVDKYQPDIEYMKSKTPKVEIVFGESGRYGPGTDSVDNAQGVFGSALWTADYLLYLMTQNVSRVHMQLSKVFGYVAWQPVQYGDITPGVRAPYFGHLLVAEFIGGSSSLRAKQISNDDRLPVYAAYDNGRLKRIAIINYNVWNGQGTRPSQNHTDFPVSLDDFVRLWPQSPPWQSKQDLSFTIAESVAAHLSGAAEAGVKTVIYLWENTASNVADGLYAPFHQVYQGVPTIFVQRSAFAQALEAVSRRDTKVPATVVLDDDMVPNTETRSIWVVFEGTVLKNESIIITTHTDAKELIAHPPRRTTILLWATGHLHYKAFSPAPGKATTRWLNDHPEYWDGRGSQTLQHGGQLKAVAACCVEHLAAKDFPEPHSSWSSAKLSPEILLAATPELNQLVRKYWSGADPNVTRVGDPARSPRSQLGEGYPLFLAGIPEISLVTAPSHLLKAWPQEFDERQLLDLAALKRQICSFLRLWRIMDNMSATEFGSISLNGTQKPLHI